MFEAVLAGTSKLTNQDGRTMVSRLHGAVVRGRVVLGQKVLAPVTGELPPDRVNVARVVLDVVVLDDECRPLDRVVVARPLLDRATPRERDRIQAGSLHLL